MAEQIFENKRQRNKSIIYYSNKLNYYKLMLLRKKWDMKNKIIIEAILRFTSR